MPQSNLELAVVAVAYIAVVGLFAWNIDRRANRLIRYIREQGPEGLWEELGAPETMKDAIRDPKRRWMTFVRSGEYKKTRYRGRLAEEIDSFRAASNRGLIGLGATGLVILYVYWPLLKPGFL